ncbi:hypothetical protein [Parasphingopyxis marina]|uniref:Uncharacterized protein n=1 Tax=Parasphingopyxis marina TaxID=2761622 RepID=A0A842HVF9_9SPHN|nr:hypothetical protein [Parasphingopyxis marina]MBC2776493.1 hypothetical protein [Parasphingopyxis marina]
MVTYPAEHYRKLAAQAEHEASETSLDNVRERNIRSRDAWLQMAERVEHNTAQREKIAAEKAARED